jgi:hypothetical protein
LQFQAPQLSTKKVSSNYIVGIGWQLCFAYFPHLTQGASQREGSHHFVARTLSDAKTLVDDEMKM